MPRGKTKNPASVWAPNGNGDPQLSPQAAAKLMRLYQEALPVMKPIDDEDRQKLYQNLRLEVLHPGEFVVWTDTWKKSGKNRTLVRKILGHASSYEGLLAIMNKQHLWGDDNVQYLFIDDPDNPTVIL
jgi:hypothetical protein